MSYPSRQQWRYARSAFVKEWLITAEPYMDSPDAPDWIRDDMPPAEWLALSRDDRTERLRRAARRVFEEAVPMPEPGDPNGGGPGGLNSIPPGLRPVAPRWASRGSWLAARKGYIEARFVPGLSRVIAGIEAPRPWIRRGLSVTREDWEGMSPEDRTAAARALGEWIFDRAFPDPDLLDPLDPDTWLAKAAVPTRTAPVPGQAVAQAEPVIQAQPVAQDPTPSRVRQAVVLCPNCGDYVAVKPGRAAVPASGGDCLHD